MLPVEVCPMRSRFRLSPAGLVACLLTSTLNAQALAVTELMTRALAGSPGKKS